MDKGDCFWGDEFNVSVPSGQISSEAARDAGVGTPDCPIVIKTDLGLRINFTMVDFASSKPLSVDQGSGYSLGNPGCVVEYATLEDSGTSKEFQLCGGGTRIRNQVYQSTGNVVRLVLSDSAIDRQFLLKYNCRYPCV